MTGLLNVYIDEAGDEGFKIPAKFVGGQGSSRWFIATAVVVPAEADRQVASSIDRIKAALWPGIPGHRKLLHWRDLKHKQKKLVLAELKSEQFVWIAVAMEKTQLDRTRFDGRIVQKIKPALKTPLYNYTIRLLFERLTRLARSGGRQLDVTFENRASLSIPEVVSYLKMLEMYPGPYGPPTVPPGLIHRVTAQAKGNSKMLQVVERRDLPSSSGGCHPVGCTRSPSPATVRGLEADAIRLRRRVGDGLAAFRPSRRPSIWPIVWPIVSQVRTRLAAWAVAGASSSSNSSSSSSRLMVASGLSRERLRLDSGRRENPL